MENKTDFVTKLEFIKATNTMRDELKSEIGSVDDKVDNLRDIVLPMVQSSKQTAENTKKISELLERSTEEQRQTNGKFYSKFNEHDVSFEAIKGQFDAVGIKLNAKTEEKKLNAGLLTTIIVAIAGIITTMFQYAPNIFGQ